MNKEVIGFLLAELVNVGRLKEPWDKIIFLYVCMVNTIYLFSFVETPHKFIIAELSIRKLGSSSVLIKNNNMKIRAYGSKALQ